MLLIQIVVNTICYLIRRGTLISEVQVEMEERSAGTSYLSFTRSIGYMLLIGIQSPANLLYLGIIFILILKQFTTTIKLSKMNRQITELAQHMALNEAERDCSENRQTRDVHDAE